MCMFISNGLTSPKWSPAWPTPRLKLGLVPVYTTLSVRVQANIYFGVLQIKSVRTNERGRHRRLTGHKYLRNKLSHKDVSSCRFFLWKKGLSPLHAVGVINASGSGRRGWEGVRVHIGRQWAQGVGRAPPGGVCGLGFGLVPVYTTLWVRVRFNIKFCVLKIKSVRTINERTPELTFSSVFIQQIIWE